jgi:hypothetical protein
MRLHIGGDLMKNLELLMMKGGFLNVFFGVV